MNMNLTLLGQTATFAFFVGCCWKFVWPLVTSAMRERQEAIAAGLQASEEADAKLADAANHAEYFGYSKPATTWLCERDMLTLPLIHI